MIVANWLARSAGVGVALWGIGHVLSAADIRPMLSLLRLMIRGLDEQSWFVRLRRRSSLSSDCL